LSVARSALSYQGLKAAKDAPVIERMKQLSAQYPRYGYRMSPGRAHRLWRTAGLQVPRKRPRKRLAATRPRPQAPCGPNQVWSYDFVFDHCANGQQLKCLTVTDEFTKEGLAIDVDGRIRSTPRHACHPNCLRVPRKYMYGTPLGGRLSDRSCGSFCYSACKPPGHPSRSAKLVALPTAALRSTSGNMIDMSSSTSIEPRAQLFPMCWEMYEIAMNGPSLDLSPPKQTKWQGESRQLVFRQSDDHRLVVSNTAPSIEKLAEAIAAK
jgi:hypothetical protein